MNRIAAALLALGAFVWIAGTSRAGYDDDWKACKGSEPEFSIDQQIAGCTGVINSGRPSQSRLVSAYNNRGLAYNAKGEHDRAIQDYDEALKLDPDKASTYNNRGVAYGDKRDHDRALQDFNEAIKREPDNTLYYRNRAQEYEGTKEFELAIADFDRAIKLKPREASYYDERCFAHFEWAASKFPAGEARERKLDEAIRDCDQAINLKPDSADAYETRARVNNFRDQYDRAISDISEAIRLERGSNFVHYLFRGIFYERKGDYEHAVEDYTSAIALEPNSSSVFLYRCQAHMKKGRASDIDLAMADCERAVKLSPDWIDAKEGFSRARSAKEALLAQANAKGTGAHIALVIGNSTYLAAPPLPNARNDAEDVAKELEKLGYKIYGYPKTDFTKSEMTLVMEDFKKASVGAAAAVVWYSGHGQQMTEEGSEVPNDWVVPVDAKISKRAEVAPNAIRLDTLKIAVLAAKQLRMVVIDACRNNPFYTGTRATRGMGRSPPTPGVLLIQSTQPGNIAQDGDGRNSPFAQAFLAEMRKGAKRDVRQLMSGVQGGVMGLTKGDQKPQIDDGLATADTVALAP